MNKKDKQLQKHLVDEMMKVYETNPDVMLYMQALMENYEKLEQENKQLKEEKDGLYNALITTRTKYNNDKAKYRRKAKRYRNILTELEEWLIQEIENIKTNYSQVNGNYFNMNYKIETYEETLDKIQELKEKYK